MGGERDICIERKEKKWRENVIETAINSLWMNKYDSEVLSNENDETDFKRNIEKYWNLLKMIKKNCHRSGKKCITNYRNNPMKGTIINRRIHSLLYYLKICLERSRTVVYSIIFCSYYFFLEYRT